MSNNAITRPAQPAALTRPQAAYEWTAEDVALIRAMTADGTSDEEFRLFLYMAHKYTLDPLVKQIWCVKNKNKRDQPAQMFAGRDGFLAIAHRTGAYDGMTTVVRVEPVALAVDYTAWENGQRRTAVFARAHQFVATCTVYHKHMTHPITVEVWEEEYSTGQALWASKPRTMLAKVAECQALRKAFNISGLYDADEITERTAPPPVTATTTAQTPAGEPVNAATGEIQGTAVEVPADNTPAATVHVPAEEGADWEKLATERARQDLITRLQSAVGACGRDWGRTLAALERREARPLPEWAVGRIEAACEAYEREAADVQAPAGVGA